MLSHCRAAVLGSPIDHSLSPLLHRAAYASCGLAPEWTYDAYEVRRGGLADFVEGLGPQWRGLSVTMPLKEEVLNAAADSSSLALQVGAANTLVRQGDGSWRGENTDVEGIRAALQDAGVGRERPPVTAAVIGSGATARSVLAALAALGVQQVTFVVRDQARESTLAQARDHGLKSDVVHEADNPAGWVGADVLVSTTPAGAADRVAQTLVDAQPAPEGQIALDVVYADWPTTFASSCEARGVRVVGGIEMLIHQAAAQFTLMTGRPAPLEEMQRVGRAAVSG
ncbi:shikimate dehydrogenase [Luteipulveratus mongoliensis]|uniref:Shikimate dehydrogenase n=1 Tax=Luteipulveratus mongoliensis TaxID=571913 RepID=A0A0K1JJ24_9MICO|nr:shikimate dehydrogenase [Luteipulveratus mongoliensis]AKU16707.1 hypothetical protein VV02_13930 [Luteipulveratus mongoliensis]